MTNYDQRLPKIIVVIFNIYKNYEGSVIITLYPGAGRRGWEAREGGGLVLCLAERIYHSALYTNSPITVRSILNSSTTDREILLYLN